MEGEITTKVAVASLFVVSFALGTLEGEAKRSLLVASLFAVAFVVGERKGETKMLLVVVAGAFARPEAGCWCVVPKVVVADEWLAD